MIGQSVRAGAVALSGSMRLLSPAEAVLAHVVAMRAEEVAPAAAAVEAVPTAEGAAGAEPEVIKKGKKEEEAEPPADAKGKKK
jgi:large subunit ribosomal protein L25